MSERQIATRAKQPSDFSGVVAVIDMKASLSVWFFAFANGAFAILFGKHFLVGTKRKTAMVFQAMVFEAFRIVFAPFTALLSGVFFVLFPPTVVLLVRAYFAVHVVTVYCGFVFMEIGKRFSLLAAWALFSAAREIKGLAFRHGSFSCCKVAFTIETTHRQGVCYGL